MSRAPLHALIWSKEQRLYELYTQGQIEQRFQPAEEAAWLAWLREVSSFAFHGKGGSLNVYLEKRPRGGAYWYAYHTKEGRTRKRYLGQTESLRLSRLEETARSLLHAQPPAATTEQGMMLSSRLAPPQLLNARQRVRRSGSHFAATRVIQWLALSAEEAGQLRLAYQESLAALDLIEQTASYALLKGYFKDVLAMVLYQWNRLEEACGWLRTIIQDAATWQQSDLLLSGYTRLMQVELARGDLSAVQQALQEFEQLEGYQGYHRRNWLPIMRAQWWLALGQMKEATDWAASIVFPEGAWERSLYDAFPVVMRVYFAELRWTEALGLLERFSGGLGRSANSRITLTYLAQYMVALHHAGQNEQAHEVAARLFALTEPEGYLRVYLDEGEPMRQALEALLTPHSQQHELAPSTRAYVSKLLAVFEQERQGAGTSLAAPAPKPALSSAQQASAVFSAPGASLTRREQEVLRLLATGASNQEIAQTLVIELPTVKKHVSNLLGKLRASSRTQAISRARALSLL